MNKKRLTHTFTIIALVLVYIGAAFADSHTKIDPRVAPPSPPDFDGLLRERADLPPELLELQILLNKLDSRVKCRNLVVDIPGSHFEDGQMVEICGPHKDNSYRITPFNIPSAPDHKLETKTHDALEAITLSGKSYVVGAALVKSPEHPTPGKEHILIMDIVVQDPEGVKEIWITSPKHLDEPIGTEGHHGGSSHLK